MEARIVSRDGLHGVRSSREWTERSQIPHSRIGCRCPTTRVNLDSRKPVSGIHRSRHSSSRVGAGGLHMESISAVLGRVVEASSPKHRAAIAQSEEVRARGGTAIISNLTSAGLGLPARSPSIDLNADEDDWRPHFLADDEAVPSASHTLYRPFDTLSDSMSTEHDVEMGRAILGSEDHDAHANPLLVAACREWSPALTRLHGAPLERKSVNTSPPLSCGQCCEPCSSRRRW